MAKFSKQFEGQLVPEWKEALVDYWQLKKDLKKIHLLNSDRAPTKHQESSLSNTLISSLRKLSLFGHQHREHGVIHVHKKLGSSVGKGDMFELKTALKQQCTRGASSQDSKDDESISGTISCDEESTRDRTEQEQGQEQDNTTYDQCDKNDLESISPQPIHL